MTKLNRLLGMLSIACEDERILQGISDDTRQLNKDWLYVCRNLPSAKQQQYIQEALDKGAVVLCEQHITKKDVYVCEQIEAIAPKLIHLFYGDLCSHLMVVGVTGTNGKTSVSSYFYQLMKQQGKAFMRIGTKEVVYRDQTLSITNTTPDKFQLALLFALANKEHLDGIVMEVSSHAIDANRICFITYDMIIYTNITQDHLDYHLTKTHYRFTKFKLHHYMKQKGIVIYNNDLPEMKEFPLLYTGKRLTFGLGEAHFPIREVNLHAHGSSFSLEGMQFTTALLGMINVYNLVSVIAAARLMNIPYEVLQEACTHLQSVPGRMEVISRAGIHIWIDYAHTPDALMTLLSFANKVKQNRIITLTGCGGNRDKQKRPIMADIVASSSDIAIFTADNPRYEHVQTILLDMLISRLGHIEIFENRYFAIKHAITCAQKNDIIIIAGKGDEQTQSICGHDYPFSDKDIINCILKEEEKYWN